MYQFRDVNESVANASLPAEAMSINGVFIEEQIDGYRTLYVSGREALAPELTLSQTGAHDGSMIDLKRYPERVIRVGYQLIAADNQSFRNAYNKLASIIAQQEATLIFNDEPDKFFKGTLSELEPPEPGRNSIVSEMSFTCVDPYKYSVQQYETEAQITENGPVLYAEYNGTFPSHPVLRAEFYPEDEADAQLTGNGDCGYVAFLTEKEKVLQFGNPDETQGADYPASQTLINQDIKNAKTSIPQAGWRTNVGTATDDTVMTGTIGEIGGRLCAGSYGSGSKWHGPFFTRTLPADKAGNTGASDFRFTIRNRFAIAEKAAVGNNQFGGFEALLVNVENGVRRIVAGFAIFKLLTGNKCTICLYGPQYKRQDGYECGYRSKMWGFALDKNKKDVGILTSTISAKDGTYSFDIAGARETLVASTTRPVHEVTIGFIQYGTLSPMTYNYCLSYKFIKDNCDTWENIPNKFAAQDILEVDSSNGSVLLNNLETPSLGALGNDWEEFVLDPGENMIGCAYSSFVESTYAPTFSMRYREVFL